MSVPRSPSPDNRLAGQRVLLGVCGGIAAYKAAHLARLLSKQGADVTVVMTEAAQRFVGADTFAALTGKPVHTSLWEKPGTALHVSLARSSDVIVVAPATASTLGRLASGISDNLLVATLLEATCPLVLASAMHTGMWQHPSTRANVEALTASGAVFVGPVVGPLAHGDEGEGRMSEAEEIADAVASVLRPRDLAGRKVVISAGPTQEPVDAVRYIGNRSSGKMGSALVREALARGAEVTLVLGPAHVSPPPAVRTIHVATAEEMRLAVLEESTDAEVVVMAAAVADFRPKSPSDSKLKKENGAPQIELEPTPDILAELGSKKGARILVGFAAETEKLQEAGAAKLRAKNVDMIVVNKVGEEGTGFGSETNQALIVTRTGAGHALQVWTKDGLARSIFDEVASNLA